MRGESGERGDVPVVPLAAAPGERESWGRPAAVVYLWGVVEWLVVTNPLQISSRLRVKALRCFGATIGEGVIFRPRTRVRFPWKLSIGDNCWIGEGVWIHNQAPVTLGHDVVVSQGTMVTTGSHAHRRDMALVTRAVHIESGAWVTARCMVLGGSVVGRSALVAPLSVVHGDIPPGAVARGNPAVVVGERFAPGNES
ncbi:acetyltransferase [Demequina activiva]|uniref:Colanic acid biosynthesis acetyltransferase WcaF n=1 Tax=Demequina activiva TaxID=1582364 RepID=A0A919UJH6_9MICO|nr:acetyltransferase [Demequina activiva]GIG53785.1 colanic acid biosynthesis acetyltransferase WcaF [Demequina activiva]